MRTPADIFHKQKTGNTADRKISWKTEWGNIGRCFEKKVYSL
jgi:hypothetical protein